MVLPASNLYKENLISSNLSDFKEVLKNIIRKNTRHSGSYQYIVPSPLSYPYQWLWDSAFHAIILSHLNPEDAKAEISSVVSKQFESGLIPHMIYWKKVPGVIDVDWGRKDTSSLTQPPIIVYAVWQIYQKDKDKNYLRTIYPHLWHYIKYLLNDRDPRENHLIGIINPDESGEDDSPRFDLPLGLPPENTPEENFHKRLELIRKNKLCNFEGPFAMKNFFWVKDVPFNSIMVKSLHCMSDIACVLGEFEQADYFFKQASLIKDAMRKYMLEDGIFWSTYGKDYQKIKILTWAIFAPLFAHIYTKDEAADLIRNHLLNKEEFNLNYLIPTVAKTEKTFNPDGFWRGPVWIATNWIVYKGLLNYGFRKEANMILQSSLELIRKSGFREHFNPLTGGGQGAKGFTWGGLVLDMLETNH